MSERLLTIEDLLDKLRCSRSTFHLLRRERGFPEPMSWGKCWLESQVDEWLLHQSQDTEKPREPAPHAPHREGGLIVDRLMTVPQVAAAYPQLFSKAALWHRIKTGQFDEVIVRRGRRVWIDLEKLSEWLEEGR